MATHTVKNISAGIRGFNSVDGLVELAPGTSAEGVEMLPAEVIASRKTGWFEIDGDEAAPAAPVDDLDVSVPKLRELAKGEQVDLTGMTSKADIQGAIRAARAARPAAGTESSTSELDAMDDVTLRTTVAAITGKPVEELADVDRTALLKLARGEA